MYRTIRSTYFAGSSYLSVFILLYLASLVLLTPNLAFSQSGEFGGDTPPEIIEGQCETPNVLLLLDRSGSMLDEDKWGQATRAVSEVFVPYFDTLRFGLMTFPTSGSCGVTEGDLAIPIGETTDADLEAIYSESLPTDVALTPLSEAIRLGQISLESVAIPDRRSFLILLTDGIETCAPEALEDSAPIAAAREAANAGINTYVIGFGSLVRRNTLREMALAGGTGAERLVDDEAELSSTLTTIVESATTEICDRLDNDCDGRVDEGLDCDEEICNSRVDDCPCNNNQDCVLGETCEEGLCTPESCDILCDIGYVCSNNTCVSEGSGQSNSNNEMTGGQSDINLMDSYMPPTQAGQEASMQQGNEAVVGSSDGCNQHTQQSLYTLALLLSGLLLMSRKKRGYYKK